MSCSGSSCWAATPAALAPSAVQNGGAESFASAVKDRSERTAARVAEARTFVDSQQAGK